VEGVVDKRKSVAYKTEGLKGSLDIWVNLSGGHVERLKDAHREIIKRKGDVHIEKRQEYENKNGPSEGDRAKHMVSVGR